jgi:type IV pilus assembly protein PilM
MGSDAVIASIPETQSFLRVIDIPVMEESEVTEAVQWEVAQHIPFGLENVYIDWQFISSTHKIEEGREEVLVGAAQKKVIDPLYAALRALHLDVAAFELESQAIVRSLITPELKQKQGLLVVDLGASATNVVIHDHGTIRFTASLSRGTSSMESALSPDERAILNAPPHQVAFKNPEAIKKKMLSVEEELVAEISGVVDFFNSLGATHEVREILLTGGGANLPGLDQAFFRFFDNVHIQRGNPWVNALRSDKQVDPPLGVSESVVFSTALGLALRPVAP